MLQTPDPDRADALADPVIDRFVESLDAVAAARTELAEPCGVLANTLRTFLEPPAPDVSSDFDDDDIPF